MRGDAFEGFPVPVELGAEFVHDTPGPCYSYTGAGGARTVLALPVDGTLFFAGGATHAGQSGTVAGAIASGCRAAEEILESRTRR